MKPIRFLAVTVVSAAVAVGATSASASADNATRSAGARVSALDRAFVESSVQGDLFEIASGTLASERATNATTRSLGSTLVSDHTMSLKDATDLASRLGIKVPTTMNGTEQNEIKEMRHESGNRFDQKFAEIETTDHLHDIAEAHFETVHGTNASVRAMAAEEIPMLTKHLILAVHDAQVVGESTVNAKTVRTMYLGIMRG